MNFLAHYYCLDNYFSAYRAFGNLMPDLFPNFTRFYNQSLRKNESNLDENSVEILEGVKLHLATDEIFHKHDLFLNNFEYTKQELLGFEKLEKSYDVAHLLVELLIDRQLILQNNTIAKSFYAHLKLVEKNSVFDFLKKTNNLRTNTIFFNNFNSFVENEYIYKLIDLNNVPIALHKILNSRLNIGELFLNDKFLLTIERIDEKISIDLLKNLENIKSQIKT